MQVVNREQVRSFIGQGDTLVIEVLPAQYFEQGPLPRAIQINTDELETKKSLLPADKTKSIVVYCANKACKNSTELGLKLSALGYTSVFKYEDGKADWENAGFPLER